jgi:long-chain acyl-CoA synthetase
MPDPYALKPWLKHYDEHVPHSLNYSDKTYAELFREATDQVPSRVAVYYMGRGITYQELDNLSTRFAHFLKKSGLQPGDTVGVNLPNIPAYYISIIGIQKAGCVLTGVSPLLQSAELEYQGSRRLSLKPGSKRLRWQVSPIFFHRLRPFWANC